MNDDFARGKCPICGCETMFRQNKNRILYSYCRNSHHSKLGREDSIQAIAKLSGGNSWNNGILYLYPLTKGQENGTNGIKQQTTTGTTGTSARTELVKSTIDIKRTVSGGTDRTTDTTGTNGTADNDICGWL